MVAHAWIWYVRSLFAAGRAQSVVGTGPGPNEDGQTHGPAQTPSRATGLRLSCPAALGQQMGQVMRKIAQVSWAKEQIRASRRNVPVVVSPPLLGADNDPAQGAGLVSANGADECGAIEGAQPKLRIGDDHGR